MGSVAQYYYDHLPSFDFATGIDKALFMEKLFDVMSRRILKDKTELQLHLGQDLTFYDEMERAVSQDEAFDRILEGESAYGDTVTDGFSLLGDASELFNPVHPLYIEGVEESQANAEEWFDSRTKVQAVNHYFYAFLPSDLDILSELTENMYDFFSYDPYLEEAYLVMSLFKSRLIGSFLSTTLIPEGMKKRAYELLEVVKDPFEQGYYWDGIKCGEYILAFLTGAPEYYKQINLNQLTMKWLPSVLLLKEEILWLNGIFGFYTEQKEGDI